MKKQKLKGDTPLGHLLQKRADKKTEDDRIQDYLNLKVEGLSEKQFKNAILDIAEKCGF